MGVTWPVSPKQRLALWCRRIIEHRRASRRSVQVTHHTTDASSVRGPRPAAVRRASDARAPRHRRSRAMEGERAAALCTAAVLWTAWGAASGVRDDSAQRRRALRESPPLLPPCQCLSSVASHETVGEAAGPGTFESEYVGSTQRSARKAVSGWSSNSRSRWWRSSRRRTTSPVVQFPPWVGLRAPGSSGGSQRPSRPM